MLVAGFTAEDELLAQVGQRKSAGLRQGDETVYLFHRGYILPRHTAAMCNPSPRTKYHLSCRIEPACLPDLVTKIYRIEPGLELFVLSALIYFSVFILFPTSAQRIPTFQNHYFGRSGIGVHQRS